MKLKLIAVLIVISSLLLAACADPEGVGGDAVGASAPGNEAADVKLPAELPEDFAIRFVSVIGAPNIYDTYTGVIQKDLVTDGTAAASFSPSKETLRRIYSKVVEYDICSIVREMTSDVLAGDDDERVGVDPLTRYEIRITAAGSTYTVTGDATADPYRWRDADADHFMSFVSFMCGVLYNTAEYKNLPPANGGYE